MLDFYLSPETGDIVIQGGQIAQVEGHSLLIQEIRNELMEPKGLDPMADKPFGSNIEKLIGWTHLPPDVIEGLIEGETMICLRQLHKRTLKTLEDRYWMKEQTYSSYGMIVAKSLQELIKEVLKIKARAVGSFVLVDVLIRTEAGTLLTMPKLTVFDKTFGS